MILKIKEVNYYGGISVLTELCFEKIGTIYEELLSVLYKKEVIALPLLCEIRGKRFTTVVDNSPICCVNTNKESVRALASFIYYNAYMALDTYPSCTVEEISQLTNQSVFTIDVLHSDGSVKPFMRLDRIDMETIFETLLERLAEEEFIELPLLCSIAGNRFNTIVNGKVLICNKNNRGSILAIASYIYYNLYAVMCPTIKQEMIWVVSHAVDFWEKSFSVENYLLDYLDLLPEASVSECKDKEDCDILLERLGIKEVELVDKFVVTMNTSSGELWMNELKSYYGTPVVLQDVRLRDPESMHQIHLGFKCENAVSKSILRQRIKEILNQLGSFKTPGYSVVFPGDNLWKNSWTARLIGA